MLRYSRTITAGSQLCCELWPSVLLSAEGLLRLVCTSLNQIRSIDQRLNQLHIKNFFNNRSANVEMKPRSPRSTAWGGRSVGVQYLLRRAHVSVKVKLLRNPVWYPLKVNSLNLHWRFSPERNDRFMRGRCNGVRREVNRQIVLQLCRKFGISLSRFGVRKQNRWRNPLSHCWTWAKCVV